MTREQLMEACIKAGHTKEECDAMMTDAIPKTDAETIRENEMLKAQLKTREDQLRQAIGIANQANETQKARDQAERQDLIDRIILDSNNKYTKDDLKDKKLTELHLIKTVLDKSMEHTFASIAAYQADQERKNKPQLTAGKWDPEQKKWIGGI